MNALHVALVGPTAAGKSAVALAAASALGDVEIVSVDAMQVYRGMDIGTAKPTPSERAAVPHHLIDVADPWEEWTVVRFRDAVREALGDVQARAKRVLLVGGTGLYLRAVVDDLDFPGEDRALRATLEAEPDTQALYSELSDADPLAASRIQPGNRRRIIRALEVIRLTGRPFSAFGPGLTDYRDPAIPVKLVGLRVPPALLAERIARRLEAMRAAGFTEEVRALLADGRGLSRTAGQAIGYAEVIGHLQGHCSEDEAYERAEIRTRRFARRQIKWFERDPRIEWLDGENAGEAGAALLGCWSACQTSA